MENNNVDLPNRLNYPIKIGVGKSIVAAAECVVQFARFVATAHGGIGYRQARLDWNPDSAWCHDQAAHQAFV
ncbi:hypothetical protein [Paraburkholderia sp. BL6669N2]|uniref:hypothetical protein n=1 Tax=Paraburkholderia sp. BL6669N2 TaxID=1938807 RepID=UPI000E27767B|nr:hypothetical protein [Paraburkholderia sp. BL6669N2]